MDHQKFPAAFEQRMRNVLGEQWENFATVHNQNSPVSIRVNPQKLSTHPYQDQIPWAATGYYLNERPPFTLDPLLHAGGYYVQEPSSMFLEQAVLQTIDPNGALNVLDLCAAPGGKSTHLLSLLSKKSLVVSNEVIRSRALILTENIQKWGSLNTVVTNNDPKDFQRLGSFFDVIVVDAPCSGEGLFRKDANAMDEWSPENILLCANRQKRILKDILPALKREGILIYSTCTYNENENEEVLKWLSEVEDVEFIRMNLDHRWGVTEIFKDNVYGYRLFPHRVKGEGFFVSVMRKRSGEDTRLKSKKLFVPPAQKVSDQIRDWVKHSQEHLFILRSDQLVHALPANKVTEIEWLAYNLYLISSGTAIAIQKHNKLIPEHALALSIHLNAENFNTIDLGLKDALQFLRRETIVVEKSERGFALVSFKGTPLGWVNVLDNRINNLYPAHWRIRMQDRKA
jgi:16S rRNA C967 or C1407 C5-methylase (RsmB/RsmF family)/NOL1/NOP2/fmu family ribosome biogenesis protein